MLKLGPLRAPTSSGPAHHHSKGLGNKNIPALLHQEPALRKSMSCPSWHPLSKGFQAPTLNPLLALAPQPVGLCLYLVTLGGFASSTGIWHRRWKISLVRSPWKQAEPLLCFYKKVINTLTGLVTFQISIVPVTFGYIVYILKLVFSFRNY